MRSEMTERDEADVAKTEVIRQKETNVVRNEAENFSVLTNVVRFAAEVATTRRRETIVAMMVTHVGMRVVDREIRMRTNRIAEDRDVMTIPVQVRPIVTTVVDAGVVRKKRKGPIGR